MKYIYFHIDEFHRDSITASVLKAEFKNRGWSLIYGNRVTSHLLKYFEWVFDVVILPKPTFINSIFGYKKIPSLKSKYVMLYTENIGIIANDTFPKMVLKGALDEEFMSGKTACVDRVDAFCFWGRQVCDTVKKTYKNLSNKCYVVGHPRHDSRALKAEILSKDTVGIISRYCTLNDYYLRHPIELIFARYTKKFKFEYQNIETGDSLSWERRGKSPDMDLYLEAVDIKNTLLLIIRLNDAGYKVSFKIHPREKVSTWIKVFKNYNLNVEIANPETPFTHWASKQKLVIGSPSTSFYDCLMVGVLPISLSGLDQFRENFVSKLFEENNKLMPHIMSPKSIDEIFFHVENSKFTEISPALKEVLKLEANYPNCKESGFKIGNVIYKVLKTSRERTVIMNLGFVSYISIAFALNAAISFARKLKIFTPTHSANFLLTPLIVRHIDKLSNIR